MEILCNHQGFLVPLVMIPANVKNGKDEIQILVTTEAVCAKPGCGKKIRLGPPTKNEPTVLESVKKVDDPQNQG